MQFDAVLLDLDCTLTDRRRSVCAAARLFHQTYALPAEITVETLQSAMLAADHWGYRDRRDFFNEVIGAIRWNTPTEMNELLRFWAHDNPKCTLAQEDALEVLTAFRRRGIKMAIVTNGEQATQSAKVRRLGLQEYVDAVVISGAVGIQKPDPRVFLHALTELGAGPGRSLFVGDHPENDILGATNAGMRTAWLCGTVKYPSHLPPPTATISRLRELLGVVLGERDKDDDADAIGAISAES